MSRYSIFLITYILGGLILSLCMPAPLAALDPNKAITQYRIKAWDTDDNLPGKSVYSIYQTDDGYIWLGTNKGLARFDGVNFATFPDSPVSSDEIRALYRSTDNTLFVGTTSHGLFIFKNGELSRHPIEATKKLPKIIAIQEDQWGNLWIGSSTEGLFRIKNGIIKPYKSVLKELNIESKINSIYKDENKDLWITSEEAIFKLANPEGGFEEIDLSMLPKPFQVFLYDKNTSTFWIGTGSGGLYYFDSKSKDPKPQKINACPHNTISVLFKDDKENLWVGAGLSGLSRIKKNNKGQYIIETLDKTKGLRDNEIYSILEDEENSLWVGTLNGGLHQMRDAKFTNITTLEKLASNDVQCIYQTRNGSLWFGGKGGLNRGKNGTAAEMELMNKKFQLPHNSVTCMLEDSSSTIWVGTWGGLVKINNGKPFPKPLKNDNIHANKIQCLVEDKEGNLKVGTKGGLFSIKNGTPIPIPKAGGGYELSINFIYIDGGKRTLIGSGEGLYQLVDNEMKQASWGKIFSNTEFHCVYRGKNGVLWFGTESGLIRDKDGIFFHYSVEHGLPSDYIYTILEDGKHNLWVGSRNGISCIPADELEKVAAGEKDLLDIRTYNEKDGMSSSWINGKAITASDGRFWFPTNGGATFINPETMRSNNKIPKVILEVVTIDDEPNLIHWVPADRLPTDNDPGKKRLEFHYTALSFINSRDISFRVKLDNYEDSDWIDRGHDRSATYTGVSHGEYTFFVEARGRDGGWEKIYPGFSFRIKAQFWEQIWFQITGAIFIILLAISLYLMRIATLKRREKLLASLVEERTHDLKERNEQLEKARQNILRSKELIEAKNVQLESQTVQLTEQSEKLKEMDQIKSRFFANISHEFRTPLTLIMGPLEQMLTNAEAHQDRKKIQLMLRNSQRLLALINQLLELSRFESGKIKLRAARQNIIPFLQGLTGNFEPLASQQELEMAFIPDEEDITLYFDAEKMEHIVGNLLVNAVKFTPAGGRVTVKAERIQEDNGQLKITVSDTGPGIPREQLPRIFERFYQSESTYENPRRKKGSGIGLALVRELVELHQGKIDVYSHEGRGTNFIITLPLDDSHLQPEEKVTIESVQTGTGANGHFGAVLANKPLEESCTDEEEPAVETVDSGKSIILVVEDSADVRQYVRGALENQYTVLEAKDGQEGLTQAQSHIPDLIISDIMMPGMDGYELSKRLREDVKTSHIPIIMLTAKASEDSVIQGLETGVDDYITKPFSTNILLARIKNLIELRRQLQLSLNREITFQPEKIAVTPIDRQFMKELRDAINQNISDPEFNVESLADKMYMDRSTVYRKILALTGETPTEFIRSLRLKRGAELLKKSSVSVLEVAFEVGFSSANYFSKCFKKKYHQLPSTYAASEGGD